MKEQTFQARHPLPEEYPNLIHFLDTQLRADQGWSLTDEYPSAFQPQNLVHSHIVKGDSGFLSHAIMRPLMVKTPLYVVKVATIGSVVTDSSYRKLGLSRNVIQGCLDQAREIGCEIAILWSNLFDFYRKMNFELAGNELNILFNKDLKLIRNDLTYRCSPQVDPQALLRLYNAHSVTSVRTVDEIRRCLKIPQSRIYTAWDQHNSLKAYAVEGKGVDLTGYVHEWGGNVHDLLSLVNYVRLDQGRDIRLIVPEHAQNLLRKALQNGLEIHHGHLGMIRVLDFPKLYEKIHRAAKAIGISDLVLKCDRHLHTIGIKKDTISTGSTTEMVRILFGPDSLASIHKIKRETDEILGKLFPLPFWIWGWDSI